MRTSVVIPTHNRTEGLSGLLADLQAQTGLAEQSTIVVVNSPEGAEVSGVVAEARERGQRVELVSTRNAIGTKRNAGARAVDCDRLVFLDDDMRLAPHVLAAHLDALDRWPNTIVCGGVDFPEQWRRRSNYYRFKQTRHLNADTAVTGQAVAANAIVTMNLSMPRALFDSLGGFDDVFSEYGGEDVEFGFRAARAGVPLRLDLAASARHEEVRLDVLGYARKLYVNAYHSTPRVIARAPEGAAVLTWALTETDLPAPLRLRIARAITGALVLGPGPVVALARWLRRTDANPRVYRPLPYKVMTILVQRLAADDRRAGRAPRAELFS